VVQGKGVPEGIPDRELFLDGEATLSLLDALVRLDLVASRSEGRRLVQQGAVHLNGDRATDANQPLEPGNYLIRVGKRRYLNLRLESSR
jgi:tyrosyl-tRNA synthetase